MYDKFSRESMELLAASQDEAREWRHQYVGSEHVLLALLKMDGTRAQRFLSEHGLTYDRVARTLESQKGQGKLRLSSEDLEPTQRLRRVMNLSYEEARREGSDRIEPEHLVLAILREGECAAADVLRAYGVPVETPGLGLPKRRSWWRRLIGK